MAGVAAIATASLSMGCGVSPAYEEPRMPPGSYTAEPGPNGEPMTADQLAQANAHAQLNADIQLGEDSDPDNYNDTDPSALTEFRPALEGHGEWVDDPAYGTVWVPAATEVGSDFVPYTTNGHWTYDDAQNYVWVSDYSWGWAPFHYGRWVRGSRYGWSWIPGRQYAGAWVVWRAGDADYGYVGWAPAGPDWYWYNGYAVGWTFGYTPYYSYCHRDYLYGPGYNGHVIRGGDPRGHDIEGRTRPYSPGGNGEPGRIAATPTVGPGRTAANPRVGPPPAALGIKPENVTAPPRANVGLAHAQTLASPRTAVAAGAAAPVQTRRRVPDNGDLVTGEPNRGFDSRAPAASAGNSHIDAVARAPQYQSPSNNGGNSGGLSAPRSSPATATASGFSGGSGNGAAPRAYYGSSTPTYRSAPSAPTYRPSAPTYRSAPNVPFRSPSVAASPSAPTFRSAPSQPTYRSAPGVASQPSAPSSHASSGYSSSRSSAPSVSHSSSSSTSHSSSSGKRR